ncbi:MAG: dihydrolipoyl dehydrogenase [Pseudomonadota bacterium]
MSNTLTVTVPDIGDFDDVEIVELHVAVGQTVAQEDPLITLETDKAAMDVPSPAAGRIAAISVKTGDRVSEGSVVLTLEASEASDVAATDAPAPAVEADLVGSPEPVAVPVSSEPADMEADLLVLGAGVGGYAAAFRAADILHGQDKKIVLIERWPTLGGVCLNVGCIPSKALLHVAKVIDDARDMRDAGVDFGEPTINAEKIVEWKDSVVGKLTGGLAYMAKQRGVAIVNGTGTFADSRHMTVATDDGERRIRFDKCVIAAGSEPVMLPGLPDDPRIMDSTGALKLEELPDRMLVIGGGIIGLEMATVYAALGVKITVAELTDRLIPEADKDLVRPLQKHITKSYENIWLNTKVTGIEAGDDGLTVSFEGADAPAAELFGRVLVAVGRRPNGHLINAEAAGVRVDKRGFIAVDKQMRTNVGHIFAVGDICGQPMLAHKGTHEGKIAAEVACGLKSSFDARVIPSIAYTDPEVAWVGMTEDRAKAMGTAYEKGVFPWSASGRALALKRGEGLTKLLFAKDSGRVIGMGAVGPHAGDLVAEAALAIELGCDAEDLALTVHAHPTLSETVGLAAEVYEGTITDLYVPPRKAR